MNIRRLTDTGEWNTRRYLSLLGNILIWAIVVIDAFYLWPTQLRGSTSMVIVSGHSMDPTYFTGDLVIARKMEPSVGDVIVYAPDGFGGSQIVHRIVGGNAVDGWVMQGDNNPTVDPFTPKADEIRGVVLVHYANFGRVTVLLLNPLVWVLVLLAAVVLLVWWSGDSCDDDPEEKDKDKADEGGAPDPEPEDEPDLIDRIVEGTEAAVARMVASAAGVGAAALAPFARRSFTPRHAAPAPRRTAPVYLRGSAVLAVVGLLAVMGSSPASASNLTVNTGSGRSTMAYASCLTQPLTASGAGAHNGNNYSYVYVEGLTSACVGLSITVDLYEGDSSPKKSVSGIVGAGGNTFAIAYHLNQVSTVVVTVNGWVKLASWVGAIDKFSCVGTDASGVVIDPGCSLSSGSGTGWGSGANRQGNLYFNGSTNAPYVVLTIDIGQVGGFTPYVVTPTDTVGTTLAPGSTCASLPVIKIMRPVQNYAYIGQTFWGGLEYSTIAANITASSVCPQ